MFDVSYLYLMYQDKDMYVYDNAVHVEKAHLDASLSSMCF